MIPDLQSILRAFDVFFLPFEVEVIAYHSDSLLLGPGGWGGGVLSYISYMGMCRCEGYGFQGV